MQLLRFQATIHRESDRQPAPLSVTFEQALAALEVLPRMFIEPDGSFVWAQTEADGTTWQVDGNLIDQGPSLAYVELSGSCPHEALDQLLQALGWPECQLLFQLTRRGAFLNLVRFQAAAVTKEGAA